MTPEGLRIQLVERDDSLFFEIGSADVKPAMTRLLSVIAGIVGKLPNDVVVEGHTDTRQYSSQRRGYSNWELSADRANSARRVLEGTGLRARQIVRVVGFADHELLMPGAPLDAQNRRVSVIVRNMSGRPSASPGLARTAVDAVDRAMAEVAQRAR
jgi:chemotaxis protein MotB